MKRGFLLITFLFTLGKSLIVNNMRILIIGGAGFLGSYLAPALAKAKHEVAICDDFSASVAYLVSKKVRSFTADATQYHTLKYVFDVFNPEIIIVSLAYSFSRESRYSFFEDIRTVIDSANVISVLLNSNIKHVYFCSSGEVYGGPETRRPIKETRKIKFSSSYHGNAKLTAERILSFRCNQLNIPITVLRIFDLFGPRIMFSPLNDVVNFLIDSFLREDQVGLVGAKRLRDFVHVEDVVKAFTGIMETNFQGIINIGTGKGTTLKEISSSLQKIIPIVYPPEEMSEKKIKKFSSVADISLLNSVLIGGWAPKNLVLNSLPALIRFRKKENARMSNAAGILDAMRGV
jgi:nucleoside-diphosphate-sugar epimerase